ncbi:hypothetical protein KBC59_02240 [Patescibacteria group bacterium]|nr:hypothetical protein [Patescibacteria group bacterium]
MKNLFHKIVAASSALALLGAGCGAAPESAQESRPSAASMEANTLASGSIDGCTHEYLPLKNGHSITYVSRMAGKDSTFTYAVKNVSGKKATIEYDFGNASKIEIEFECSEDGIRALSQVDFSKAFGGPIASATSKTKSASGELVPKDFHVGSAWSQTFESEAEIENEAMKNMGMSKFTTIMKMDHKAVGEESVTVPAGTYTAIKVETDMTITTKFSPTAAPTESKMKTTAYWVKGIGMVKSVSGEGSTASLMEATAVTK